MPCLADCTSDTQVRSHTYTLPLCVVQVPAWVRALLLLLLLRHHPAGHRMARQGSPLMRLVVMEAVRDEEVVGGR
jgi:hypothetical protein